MTQTEFLLDMLQYYSVDPGARRCSDTSKSYMHASNCFYSPSTAGKLTSQGCAIGRKLTKENALAADRIGNSNAPINKICREYSNLLPEWMRAMSSDFLRDIQMLHDNEDFWTTDGLSQQGVSRLNLLIGRYRLNPTDFYAFTKVARLADED